MKKLTLLAALLVAISVIAPAATRSKKSEISRNLDIFNALYKELQTFMSIRLMPKVKSITRYCSDVERH